MKNFFSKAIVCAGVLASALALSSVATFAATANAPATTDINWTYAAEHPADPEATGLTTLTVSASGNNSEIKQDVYFNDGTVIAKDSTKTITGVKWSNGANATITLNNTQDSAGYLTIYAVVQTSNTSKYTGTVSTNSAGATIDGNALIYPGGQSSETNKVSPVKVNVTKNGTYTFTQNSGKEANIVYVTFTKTGDVSNDPALYITSNKTLSLDVNDESTITVDTENFTNDPIITYTSTDINEEFISISSDGVIKAKKATNDEITITVTATYGSETASQEITITKINAIALKVNSGIGEVAVYSGLSGEDNSTIPNGTIMATYFKAINNGNDLLLKVNENNEGIAVLTAKSGKANIEFETTVPLNITISFGSTGTTNSTNLALKNVATGIQIGETANVLGTSGGLLEITDVPAGKYQIYTPGSDRGTRVYSVTFSDVVPTNQSYFMPVSVINYDGNTYIVGAIAKNNIENVGGKVGLAGSKTDEELTTKTVPASTNGSSSYVYKAIMVGEDVLIGDPNAANPETYYFAVKLPGTGATYHVKGFAQLEENGVYVASDVVTPAITTK